MDKLAFELCLNHSTTLLLQEYQDLLACLAAEPAPMIIDSKVQALFPDLMNQIPAQAMLGLPAGETAKSLSTVERIYAFLSSQNLTTKTAVIVIGGGTVTDVAGFAVATFKRGCRLHLIPTTLIGMIDAALGGKTALNLNEIKNQIGTFYPAASVILCPHLLSTLPVAEHKNGLAEMLKLRLIKPDLPEIPPLQNGFPTSQILLQYASAKLVVCSQDPTDRSSRRILNLGHSFGHILESVSAFSLQHGEAVAWGIAAAARLSVLLKHTEQAIADNIIGILQRYGFFTTLAPELRARYQEAFPALAAQDKKNLSSQLTLILFDRQGQPEICPDLPLQHITALLPHIL